MTFKSFITKATDGLLNDKFRQSFLVAVLSFLLSIISLIACITHWIRDVETIKVFAIISTVGFVIAASIFFLTVFVNKYHSVWLFYL